MVGMTPRRSAPDSGSFAAAAASASSWASFSTTLALAAISRPRAVNTTDRLLRSTSEAFSSASSSWMPALSVDWETKQASAARPKCRCSSSAVR